MELSDKELQDYLYVVGESLIDEEIQSKIREILKCAICYDIPKEKDLKVQTCEKGHHFCTRCYKKLKHCGICRGQFFHGRNFVVEEIINQLGSSLGLNKVNLPPPDGTPNLVPGVFQCLHQCSDQLRATYMLNHIRTKHSQNLLDDVRSNPYLKSFDCLFQVSFTLNKKFISSFQISDMGLFTVIININDTHLIGSTHMLTDPATLSKFQYKLTVKVNKAGFSNELSVSDCDLFDYSYDAEKIGTSQKCLKIDVDKLQSLTDIGTDLQMLLSINRKKGEKNKSYDKYKIMTVLPTPPVAFSSDRKQRRNRQRNFRKKKIRQLLRNRSPTDSLTKTVQLLHL